MLSNHFTIYRYSAPLLRIPSWLKKQIPTSRIFLQQRVSNNNQLTKRSPPSASSLRLTRGTVTTRDQLISSTSPPVNQQEQHMEELVKKSSTVLFRLSSIFPFDFFPDTIIIDETKIEIRENTFFLFEKVCPILISDIKTVTLSCGPLFASMYIELIGPQQNPDPIHYLWKWDAKRASHIIMGLMTCFQEGVELSKLTSDHIVDRLDAIGRAG